MMWFTTLRQFVRQKFGWLDTVADIAIMGCFVYVAVIVVPDIFKIDINNTKLKDIVENMLTAALSLSFWKEKIIIIAMLLSATICVWLIFFCLITAYISLCTRNGRHVARRNFQRFFRQQDHNNNQWDNPGLMNGHAFQFQ
ncbi:uncharacterized protein LOC115245571 [Formica exsecta]|uniref:uncharacterized protein LOC115245571 n=1 Tax=Formica exsecta TaxID=72781 RepID=UPI0011443EF9|nr:uncharacterized protein LOC115245571 [Formica exsecta]